MDMPIKPVSPMRANDLFCFDDDEQQTPAEKPSVDSNSISTAEHDDGSLQAAIERAMAKGESLPPDEFAQNQEPFHEKEETMAEFRKHLERQGQGS